LTLRDSIETRYRALLANRELVPDTAQESAVRHLQRLATQLRRYRGQWCFFSAVEPPRGLYIWGDVGRGKSMLMDLFFEAVATAPKRRVHFNAFMIETHARIHRARQVGADDPISSVAKKIAEEATLLCFDEFQVTDVADAMILGRVFEQLFDLGVVVVATSNKAPQRLYEGGLNRQLFLSFITLIERQLDIIELNGPTDYRLQRLSQLDTYITPLGPDADAKMDAAWARLTDKRRGASAVLTILGRELRVPQAAKGVARFSFGDLCRQPLAAVDYLEIAQHFHTVLVDHIPAMGPSNRNEARRLTILIDTLYDENVKLICSAALPPAALYPEGDGAEAFRRTASRLTEMQSAAYMRRGHAVHGSAVEKVEAPA